MTELYEAILTRDVERVKLLVRSHCSHSAELARDTILRFAVLACAPSLHSRSTLYAALAITDLFDRLVDPCPLIVCCAAYACESRVPWGEVPVTTPPHFPASFIADDASIDEAIEDEDIHAAERWLAALLESDHVATPFFDAAARHPGEEGYGFCTAAASWRIARKFPPQARFGVLRVALLEWLHSRAVPGELSGGRENAVGLAAETYVRSGGRPDRFQPLLLADAIVIAEEITGDPGRYGSLLDRYLVDPASGGSELEPWVWNESELAYRYAVDYATFLQSIPVSARLRKSIPGDACEKIPTAARQFLKGSDGFEAWSFA